MKPLDPKKVASEVWYGKKSGKYTKLQRGVSTVYSQLYPFEDLLNYTSGIIHNVRLVGKENLFDSWSLFLTKMNIEFNLMVCLE